MIQSELGSLHHFCKNAFQEHVQEVSIEENGIFEIVLANRNVHKHSQ